jgi:hypothetical protein
MDSMPLLLDAQVRFGLLLVPRVRTKQRPKLIVANALAPRSRFRMSLLS